jgi:xanthine dehydrogenase accessory factor
MAEVLAVKNGVALSPVHSVAAMKAAGTAV